MRALRMTRIIRLVRLARLARVALGAEGKSWSCQTGEHHGAAIGKLRRLVNEWQALSQMELLLKVFVEARHARHVLRNAWTGAMQSQVLAHKTRGSLLPLSKGETCCQWKETAHGSGATSLMLLSLVFLDLDAKVKSGFATFNRRHLKGNSPQWDEFCPSKSSVEVQSPWPSLAYFMWWMNLHVEVWRLGETSKRQLRSMKTHGR